MKLDTRRMFQFHNICFILISHRITSIIHHKHVIGSSWGKFPSLGGEIAKRLSGEWGNHSCVHFSFLLFLFHRPSPPSPPHLIASNFESRANFILWETPRWKTHRFVWEKSPWLLRRFRGKTWPHVTKSPVHPSNFHGLHQHLWIS